MIAEIENIRELDRGQKIVREKESTEKKERER